MMRTGLAALCAVTLGACSGAVSPNVAGLAMTLVAVAPGQNLPYGEFATSCETPDADLGTRIATAAGFELYDTQPQSTTLRTHYLTGFNDGCPRQFTAALALFGDVATHEALRYGDGGGAFTPTDAAYEQVRGCGSAGQACESGLEGVAQQTAFLTVYRAFGSSGDWADVLLSGGEIVAMDFEN